MKKALALALLLVTATVGFTPSAHAKAKSIDVKVVNGETRVRTDLYYQGKFDMVYPTRDIKVAFDETVKLLEPMYKEQTYDQVMSLMFTYGTVIDMDHNVVLNETENRTYFPHYGGMTIEYVLSNFPALNSPIEVAPAPAPVVVDPTPVPAPAPVVVSPTPAPAPVVTAPVVNSSAVTQPQAIEIARPYVTNGTLNRAVEGKLNSAPVWKVKFDVAGGVSTTVQVEIATGKVLKVS
jgi:hypothetical protein